MKQLKDLTAALKAKEHQESRLLKALEQASLIPENCLLVLPVRRVGRSKSYKYLKDLVALEPAMPLRIARARSWSMHGKLAEEPTISDAFDISCRNSSHTAS